MKILIINKFLYPRGGAETYLLQIGQYFKKIGNEVEYFGMYDEKNIVGNSWDCYTTNVDFHTFSLKKFMYPFKIIYSIEARKRIRKVLDNFSPDIVHLNNINFQITPSIIDEIYKKKIPIIQTVHDSQMVCPNHLMYHYRHKDVCNLCIKHTKWHCFFGKCIHGSYIKSLIGVIEALLYKYRKTYSKVKYFICPSFFMENCLRQANINKIIVMHNFIKDIKHDEGYLKEEYVLFFGRLSEEKGIRVFLNCVRKLPKIRFVVAGDGPLKELCYNIENLEYVGFKRENELNKLVEEALFSVYPSLCYENCPLSILESITLGTPVIVSNRGGIPELIENNLTGIVLEEVTETCLMENIKMLYYNREKLTFMTEQCRKKGMDFLTIKEYCEKLLCIYKKCIET